MSDDIIYDYERQLSLILKKHSKRASGTIRDCENSYTAIDANVEVYNCFINLLFGKHSILGLNLDVEMASFRSRRGLIQSSLRSIHSLPAEMVSFVSSPSDMKSFDFTHESYGIGLDEATVFEDYISDDRVLFQQYNIAELEKDTSSFSKRISFFIAELSEKLHKDPTHSIGVENNITIGRVNKIQSNGSCWVISRVPLNGGNIVDLVALYFSQIPRSRSHNPSSPLQSDIRKTFGKIILHTFSAFEELQRNDREIFQREALDIVSARLPYFMDKHEAPAFNVAKLLKKLENSCGLHPSMGCGNDSNDVKIRFIRTEFLIRANKEDGEENKLLPQLNIYPPSHARALKVDSMVFSHRLSKSVVKFLLGMWAKESEWEIRYSNDQVFEMHSDFRDTFDIKIKEKEFGRWLFHANSDKIHGIYATNLKGNNGTNEFWKLHNFDVGDIENNTTVAFLLSERVKSIETKTPLPFGILTFESNVPDAFSSDDLRIFTQISNTLATILDASNFCNSFVDYSTKLRKAIVEYQYGNSPDFGKFAYELHRLDRDVLERLVMTEDLDTWKSIEKFQPDIPETIITNEQAIKAFSPLFDDSSVDCEKKLDKCLVEKRASLEKEWIEVKHSRVLLDFLEAIPSNNKWNARLNAIPRALAKRRVQSPTIKRFPTGLSADAIFILDDAGEMRQVLKFSSSEDIMGEKKAYQDFIRYHVPLAARVPEGGFSIETDGSDADAGFGVLVSDLVAGQVDGGVGNPKSLADLIISIMKREPWGRKTNIQACEIDCINAIAHHFYANISRWIRPLNESSLEQKAINWINTINDTGSIIRDSSRIDELSTFGAYKGPQHTKEEDTILALMSSLDKVIINTLNKFKADLEITNKDTATDMYFDDFTDIKDENLKSIFGNWEKKAYFKDTSITNIEELIAVIHGDLNPQNLTWSSSYQKFQIIDFEHVRFGCRGGDQLKLIFSTALHLHSQFISEDSAPKTSLIKLSENIEYMIVVIFCASFTLSENSKVEEGNSFLNKFLINIQFGKEEREKADQDESLFLAKLVKVIFRTIFTSAPSEMNSIHKLDDIDFNEYIDLVWTDQIKFLKKSMWCFSIKEFSYALTSLNKDSTDGGFKRVKYWQKQLEKNPNWSISEVLKQIDGKGSNTSSDGLVSSLICSYLAFRSVCAGLRE